MGLSSMATIGKVDTFQVAEYIQNYTNIIEINSYWVDIGLCCINKIKEWHTDNT